MNQRRTRGKIELALPFAKIALLAAIDGLLSAVVRRAHAVLGGRRSLLLIAAAAILVALLTRFPRYETLPKLPEDVQNQAMSWQVRHPLTPIPADLKNIALHGGAASHVDKMELRLTVPLLGRVSGTGDWTVVVWSPIAAILLFYLFALCTRDAMGDTTATAFFVIGLGATFFGAWGFNDFIFGDAVGLALMLLSVCCLSRPWMSGLCFLGAAFCDERSVTAAPLLLLYFIVRCSQPEEKTQRNQLLFAIVGMICVWMVLRWWLSATFHLSTGTSLLATWETFRGHMTSRQTFFSLVGLFRASWIIPALTVRRLILQKDWMLATSLVAAFGIAIVPAFLVVDVNRSICYTVMIFLISLRLLWHNADAPKKYLAAIMLVNILISPPSKTIFRLLA